MRPGFTLNLGVRWETDTPVTDMNNHMNGFDQNAINPVSGTPGVVKFAGISGYLELQRRVCETREAILARVQHGGHLHLVEVPG